MRSPYNDFAFLRMANVKFLKKYICFRRNVVLCAWRCYNGKNSKLVTEKGIEEKV